MSLKAHTFHVWKCSFTTEGSVTFLSTDEPSGDLVAVRALFFNLVILLLQYQRKQLFTHAEMFKRNNLDKNGFLLPQNTRLEVIQMIILFQLICTVEFFLFFCPFCYFIKLFTYKWYYWLRSVSWKSRSSRDYACSFHDGKLEATSIHCLLSALALEAWC